MERHPNLRPEMRSILLDFLMGLCAGYQLHREMLCLAQDYFDRFIAMQENVLPSQLQLIGIFTLLIAANMEEICYLSPFQLADITGGECSAEKLSAWKLIS